MSTHQISDFHAFLIAAAESAATMTIKERVLAEFYADLKAIRMTKRERILAGQFDTLKGLQEMEDICASAKCHVQRLSDHEDPWPLYEAARAAMAEAYAKPRDWEEDYALSVLMQTEKDFCARLREIVGTRPNLFAGASPASQRSATMILMEQNVILFPKDRVVVRAVETSLREFRSLFAEQAQQLARTSGRPHGGRAASMRNFLRRTANIWQSHRVLLEIVCDNDPQYEELFHIVERIARRASRIAEAPVEDIPRLLATTSSGSDEQEEIDE